MTVGVGMRAGRNQVQAVFGQGGVGVVFQVVDGKGSVFAMKMLRPEHDADTRGRFRKEVAIMRGMDHPNVMPILDASAPDDALQWYLMPLAICGSLASPIPNQRSWEVRARRPRAPGAPHRARHSP